MPRTSRPMRVHPIVLRRAEVIRVTDISPNMRRVTLAGEDLRPGSMGDGYERPAFRSDGFDDHIKLVVPPADGELPRIGTQQETRFAWNPEALAFTRDYTVRSWDPEAGTFDVDVVRHDHGLAAAWAFRAEPGEVIHFAGPKSCATINRDADWHLLAGDETALPAIGRWLEEAPAGTRGRVIVEVPEAADRQRIDTAADVEITWLIRDGVPAGESTLLFDAVRELRLPEGRVYAWCGGEAMSIAPIRRYLRRELGLPKEDVEVVGYWRRPKRAADEQAAPRDDAERLVPASGGDEETSMELLHEVHEMTELAPPVVTRAAVTLGIGLLIGSGVTTLDALSAETAVPAARLKVLLDAMQALGLVDADPDGYRNTARGGVLMEESAAEELSLDDPVARDALALVDLVDVLRSGSPSARLGGDWRERRRAQPELDGAWQDRHAEALQYVIDPLRRLEAVSRAGTLAVFGDGAAYVADRIATGRTVQLPGEDAAWGPHDCGVLVAALEGRGDDEAIALLERALSAGGRLVVAEVTSDRAASDDHAAERALLSLTLTGRPQRTRDEVHALLRRAGATATETETLGWGFGPFGTVTIAHA